MKNPMQKIRRFFVRSRTYNAAARTATQMPADDDGDSTRLSGAFIVVLALHIIAVVGVFAFARIKESRSSKTASQGNPTQTAAPKNAPAKPAAAKPAPVKPAAPIVAASLAPANPTLTPHATPKPATVVQSTPSPAETKPVQTNAQKAALPPADRKTTKTYVVRKNDSPMKIAREHGCTYEELMKVNSIKDPKKIQPGQVLKLPVKNG
ncbi:MAG: LysM domain-containing protein [Chthoniobacteraceae bacterium]